MVRGIAVLFIFLSQQPCAEPVTKVSIQIAAKSMIARLYPDTEVASIAAGDLDGDGIPDVAYVVQDSMGAALVGVLRGQDGGVLVPWGKSKEITTFTTVEVDIRRRALFVDKYYASLTTVSNYEAQFQFRKGELVCIGLKETHQSPIHDDEPGPRYSENGSTNFLTGETISQVEKDGKVTLSRQKEPVEALVKFQDWGENF